MIGRHQLEYLLYVMATAGIRRGEALGLRWSDVDITKSALHLRRALTRAPDGALELGSLKTRTPRRVILPASTLRIVELQRERQRLWQLCAGDAWQNDLDPVFTERDGAHLTPQRVSQRFRRLVRRTPLPTIRLHDLRHSHATIQFGGRRVAPCREQAARAQHNVHDPERIRARGRSDCRTVPLVLRR